jgi:hypothetical protein
MKNVIILILLLMAPCLFAQEKVSYLVSDIEGNVRFHKGKERVELIKGQTLSEDDILTVSANSSVVLLNPRESKMYTVKGIYSGTLEKYVKRNEQNCVTTVTKQYMRYLLAQMLNNKKKRAEQTEDGTATVFRSLDSIIQTLDSIPETE